jgi:hypothetical protein
MSISVLLGFLPWILFYLLPLHTLNQLKFGITGLFLLTILTSYRDLKRKFILPWGTLLFFAFVFFAIVVFDLKALAGYMAVLAYGTLATLALGSLAIGKPFTLQYARAEVPKEKWQNPTFIFINQILTLVWGMSFLFNLSINVLHKIYALPNLLIAILANSSSVAAILFTAWFPKWYRKRASKKM